MKKKMIELNIVVGLSILFAANACGQTGERYDLTWSTIDGGGTTSSSERFTLTGTIGQPDAAYSASAGYGIQGGFWSGGPLCFVDFQEFAQFALMWLSFDAHVAADLDGDSNVDLTDLRMFADQWLHVCPKGWPLW